nr:hypothetical protein [Tanacetum cinerariifolium]
VMEFADDGVFGLNEEEELGDCVLDDELTFNYPGISRVVWRLKSLSGKGLGFDALLAIVGGNGTKSNGVKRKDLVWVRMSVNHHNILP